MAPDAGTEARCERKVTISEFAASPSRSEPAPILGRTEKGLDHLSLQEIAIELDQLGLPEVVSGKAIVRRTIACVLTPETQQTGQSATLRPINVQSVAGTQAMKGRP